MAEEDDQMEDAAEGTSELQEMPKRKMRVGLIMDSDEQEGQKRKNLGQPETETGIINF